LYLALKVKNETSPTHPTHLSGGGYIMNQCGSLNKLCAQYCRAVVNHAPVCAHHERFFPDEDPFCPQCGPEVLETRDHVLFSCPAYIQKSRFPTNTAALAFCDGDTSKLRTFLDDNPRAFAFTSTFFPNRPATPVHDPDHLSNWEEYQRDIFRHPDTNDGYSSFASS
ncbi:hypothetical protein BD779DRAFT_1450331, partial [Infundibulicybe gibba]